MEHYSVLLKESIEALNIQKQGIYVDGTLGRGGHSVEILKRIPEGHLYAFDRDHIAIEESLTRLSKIADNFTLIHNRFSALSTELEMRDITHINGMILDLGVSSPQFDEAARGFSYRFDAPLDMRMDQRQSLDAYHIVNTWDFHDLMRIFYQYGEEKYAKQIARKIEKQRMVQPIATTLQLVEVIKASLPSNVLNKKGHPAKKVFQAIRIAVNDELKELQLVLEDAMRMLAIHGRLAVITFQSLEDRIVKDSFMKKSSVEQIDKRIPILPEQMKQPDFQLVNKKPIVADDIELEANNRSHSAKLRIIERIG